MALEELGAVFVKLGQMMSTRADWLPPAYQNELAKLQDAAPPVPVDVIRATIAADLDQPVERLFATFDDMPLAAASIGQVHSATLFDGTEVIVKVRRPGITEQVETDLAILARIATRLTRTSAWLASYDIEGIVVEFARTLRAELDYPREAQNAERFANNLASVPYAVIPAVHFQLCSTSVLTLERLHGIKISDRPALLAAGYDCAQIARHAAELELHMIVEDGFYHADPHPGNFVITRAGAIGLMDFGMVGTISPDMRRDLADLLVALSTRDMNALVDTLLDMGVSPPQHGRAALARDLDRMLVDIYDQPLGDIALGSVLRNVLALLREHRLRMPAHLSLLFKTIVMSEALGTLLDPTFRITYVLEPYVGRLLRSAYAPDTIGKQLIRSAPDVLWLGSEFPRHLRRLIGELENGTLQVGIQTAQVESLIRRVETIANRLVLGILAAAFIVGLAVILSVYRPGDSRQWLEVFFGLGLVVACILGAMLFWYILRSERRKTR
jgi:ubiquinone biosynthesis protein